ncbi:hypothetical protein [Sphingobacterium sp. MYb382]|uniref:hypothetical protein n=1 Tax=Sphingobacterium sp. MYb382 TaxID=2745278 RepID=UPI0030B30856
MEKNWLKVATYTDALIGELNKQLLEEQGIAAVLINKQDSSFIVGRIELFVHQDNESAALALLTAEETKGEDEN